MLLTRRSPRLVAVVTLVTCLAAAASASTASASTASASTAGAATTAGATARYSRSVARVPEVDGIRWSAAGRATDGIRWQMAEPVADGSVTGAS